MSMLKTALLTLFASAVMAGAVQGVEKQDESKVKVKAEKKTAAVAMCPVMDKAIDASVYSYYKNRRVYFCCEHCKETFAKEPAKYAERVEQQWAAMPRIRRQVNCPVTGEPIKLAFYVEEPDMRIYFASEEAKKTWESWSPTKRKTRTPKMFTFQTKCVISGNDINPEVFRDLNGTRVYFFCNNCAGEGEHAPKETAKKAQEQSKKNSGAFTSQQLELLKGLMEKQKANDTKANEKKAKQTG